MQEMIKKKEESPGQQEYQYFTTNLAIHLASINIPTQEYGRYYCCNPIPWNAMATHPELDEYDSFGFGIIALCDVTYQKALCWIDHLMSQTRRNQKIMRLG